MSMSSYLAGASEPPLIERTIGEVLREAVAKWPDREAVVSLEQGVRLTYAELGRSVDRLAAGLLEMGLQKGDRVGVWAPNCFEWTLLQFATARAGLIQVNINPAYRLSELEYVLNKVGVRALFATERFKTSEYAEMVETLASDISKGRAPSNGGKVPSLDHVVLIGGNHRTGWRAFADIVADPQGRIDAVAETLASGEAINIQFTSGTTGKPKGATLSHRNIINNAHFVGLAMGMRAGDRLCIPVPLYHCFGMVMANLACVIHGATIVYRTTGNVRDPGQPLPSSCD